MSVWSFNTEAKISYSNFSVFIFSHLVIILVSMASYAEDQPIYIENMSNSSKVAILGNQISNNVKSGQILTPGDRVQTTDSSARIAFADGSLLTLGKNSELEIKKTELDSQSKQNVKTVFLKAGFIHARIHHQEGEPSPHFYIETKTAVVGVRGTEFTMHSAENDDLKIHVLEGKVGIASDRSKFESAQLISTGQMVNAKAKLISPPESFNLAEYRKKLSLEYPEVHKVIYNKIKSQTESVKPKRRHRK